MLFLLRLIHPSTNLVDRADNGYFTQFFLSLFFSFSLLWNLENNVLLLFFSSVLSSDLVICLSVHLSVVSVLNNFLSSMFLFNLILSALPVPFCFFLSSLFCSPFCLFLLCCSILLCPFTYFLISLVISFCFSNLLFFLFSFPIALCFLLAVFFLFFFSLFLIVL